MHFRTMILGLLRKLRASIYTSKYACSGFKPRQINNIAKLEIMPTVHCISRLTLLGNTRSHQVEMCLMLKQGVSTANVWKGRLGWDDLFLILSSLFHSMVLVWRQWCVAPNVCSVVLCCARPKKKRDARIREPIQLTGQVGDKSSTLWETKIALIINSKKYIF